jgi:hypothetical protein
VVGSPQLANVPTSQFLRFIFAQLDRFKDSSSPLELLDEMRKPDFSQLSAEERQIVFEVTAKIRREMM